MEDKIDVKIGTPVEAEWTEILKAQERALINSRINEEIAEILIKVAKKHISEEEKK
jgi:hypothetical protein